MVCAMGGTRRRRGFEPRFVCPSRGLLARSPPPPPSASPSTTGTADGWVVCLVLVVLFLSFPGPNHRANHRAHRKTRHRAQHTCSSAPRRRYRRPTGAASPPCIPLGGFEPASSGQQPAAQPLWHAAKSHGYEPLALSKPMLSYGHELNRGNRSHRTSRHPTPFLPLPAHELQRHPWVSRPCARQQHTGLAQWGLRAGKHGSTDQGCGTR